MNDRPESRVPHLFAPFALRELVLANRIVVSPMCQYSAVDGCATDWHVVHWGQLLLSGAAMLTIEATAVTAEGRISPGDLGLWDDRSERALGDALARARRCMPGVPVAIQLSHAGRKGSSARPWEGGHLLSPIHGGWLPEAPSAIAHAQDETPPAEMSVADIARVRDAFAESARRADRLNLDAIELHCAHGYLLHEFLSPVANHRADAYGGSRDARMRFPLEVFDAVRAVWPAHKPLGVRVSSTDWLEHRPDQPSWTLDDTLAFAHALRARGCDWIDASSGGVSPMQKIAIGPGYQVPFARALRESTGLSTIAVGLVTEAEQADAIVRRGDADLVALARALLWDPRWPWRAAAALGGLVAGPPQYSRSLPREAAQVFGDVTIRQR